MEKYNYNNALYNDIKNYIKDEKINIQEYDKEDLFEKLQDELWDQDRITGNGPYGYTDEQTCSEYVSGNLKIAFEALREFDVRLRDVPDTFPAKYVDSTIRCYLFHEELMEVLNDLYNDIIQ